MKNGSIQVCLSIFMPPVHVTVVTCLHLCLIGLLCVETKTFSWTCSASSSCPLLGRSFADGGDEQGLNSNTWIVHLDTRLKEFLGKTAELSTFFH